MGKAKQQKASSSQHVTEGTQASQHVTESTQASLAVGTDAKVQKDYLDMKDVPDEGGLPHAGYLVLRKGEVVRILYVGSESTGDASWLYGEVCKSIPPDGNGRRGWLPTSAVNIPSSAPTVRTPPVPAAEVRLTPANFSSSSAGALGTASNGSTGPGPPLDRTPNKPRAQPRKEETQKARQQLIRKPAATDPTAPLPATLAAAFDEALAAGYVNDEGKRGKKSTAKQNRQQSNLDDPFPALPGHSGLHWWGEPEEGSPPQMPRPVESSGPPPKRDAVKTITRNRAVAAAAAAEAEAKETKFGRGNRSRKSCTTCPICMESYAANRRRAQLPCCGVEMCVQCSEKSLRSRRCYFCRQEADEFPSLCASAGSSVQAY